MALIACQECNKGISDKAPACPHCGFPMNGRHAPPSQAIADAAPAAATVNRPAAAETDTPRTHIGTWLVLLAIIAACFWYFNSPGYKKQFKADMPVAVKYRTALTGPGLVLMVENRSSRHLALLATLKNPSLKNARNFRFDIPPGGTTEAGYREGWAFSSGDQITLSHDDYKDWQGNIP